MGDDREWRRILAVSDAVALAEREPRSADRAESARVFAERTEAGASSTRLYAGLLEAAARGQIQRELANLLRADDDRRARATTTTARPSDGVADTVAEAGGWRRMTPTVVAILVAVCGPVLLYPRRRGPGFIAPLEDVSVWAGVLSVIAALWFVFVEPRRPGSRLFSAGLLMVMAVITTIGLVIFSARTIQGEDVDAVTRGIVFTTLIAAVVIYLVGFVRQRRPARAEARDADGESAARLAGVDDRLQHELRTRRDRIPADQWPDPAALLPAVRILFERGLVDEDGARRILRELV